MAGVPGLAAFYGIGEESTWGTSVARTNFKAAMASGDAVTLDRTILESEDIRDAEPLSEFNIEGKRFVKGSVEFEALHRGMLLWWKHALGHTVTPTGTNPYTYNFNPPSVPDIVGKGLTLEVARSSSINSWIYSGIKIDKAVLTAKHNSIAKVQFELIGKDSTTGARTTPTYPSNPKIALPTAQSTALCQIGGSARICTGFVWTYQNNYEPRWDGHQKTGLEPYRSQLCSSQVSLDLQLEGLTEYTDFLAFTSRDIVLTIDQGSNAQLSLTLRNCLLASNPDPYVNSMGIITWNPTFKAYPTASTRSTQLQIITNEAAIA